jgi:hypothetical protein
MSIISDQSRAARTPQDRQRGSPEELCEHDGGYGPPSGAARARVELLAVQVDIEQDRREASWRPVDGVAEGREFPLVPALLAGLQT